MRNRAHSIDADLGALVQRHGCSVSHVVVDPACGRFRAAGIDGLIPYRRGFRCLVGIGDPICDERHSDELAERFRLSCAAQKLSTVFAAASERFTQRALARGYASVEFGEELIFDPRRDPQSGGRGRELRKKVQRAQRAGVNVLEHQGDFDVERGLESLARAWVERRRGPQVFITPVLLFAERTGRRWFYAACGTQLLGVLSLLRLDARGGWVFEHLLTEPDAPQGTSEQLVTVALGALGREGCGYATFGPSTLSQLGRMQRVGWYGQVVGRAVFNSAARWFHLDSLSQYRKKFQVSAVEPSHLLFHPGIGVREATGLLRAFNVTLRW
jgi:phosphatidylglycerol lysyltransferase